MPRRPRVLIPGAPLHVIQRGNNRSACFFSEHDYRYYLEQLSRLADEHGCEIHAYCLMTNHTHLLLTPKGADSAALMMKALGQRYTQHVNRTYQRTGTLWEGRFRSCPIQAERYLLACYRYIELNPVRAGMVSHPAEYRWSSYGVNAAEADSSFVTSHPLYLALGRNPASRRGAYRELFRHALEPGTVNEIREATNGNVALAHPRFAAEIEQTLGRRVTAGRPGRPRSR